MKLIQSARWLSSRLLVPIVCLLLFAWVSGFGQTRTHDLGDFKLRIQANETINSNSVQPTGEWPQDHFRYGQIVWHNKGFVVGKWVDSTGTEHVKEEFFDPVSYNRTAPYGITEFRRHQPPEVWVYADGQMQLSSRRFDGTVDPNLPADMMIEQHYKALPGFDVIARSYSYSNPNHDDYVIVYNRYLCTFDWDLDPQPETNTSQVLENVYFFVGYSFQTAEGTYLTYSRWYEEAKDDWATYEKYRPETATGGRDLLVSYGWDGDYPDLTEFEAGGQEFDDTGDPRYATGEEGSDPMPSGEFISSAYGGFAALHVDKSTSDHSDDPTQPTSIIGNISIYNVWDSDFTGYATIWDWAASGVKQTVQDQSGWPTDASGQEAEFPFQSFGPYNLALGDSVVIVYAVGANGISSKLAIEKGLEWRAWYRGESGATFDNDAKNELLATGKDSLFQTMDRALWAWQQKLNIPDPLPAPALTVKSGPNVIYLEWEDMSNAGDYDTGTPDLSSYNIYRKRGEFLVDTYNELNSAGTHLKWELIAANVPKTQMTYVDSAVVRGEAYHYAVTATDNDGLESSRYANRSELPAYAFAPGEPTAKNVRVVPNPYILKAGEYNFTGDDNKLLFVNLPPYCTLYIYTASGDLIKTIEHQTGSADATWDQVTDANQIVASGVYILRVDAAKDLEGKSITSTIEKFVIIR
jgi:hypothetical protein